MARKQSKTKIRSSLNFLRWPVAQTRNIPVSWLKAAVWCVAVACVIVAAGFGLNVLERRVLAGKAHAAPKVSVLAIVNTPEWMPKTLADHIEASVLPAEANYYDESLTDTIWRNAAASPWVKRVISVEKKVSPDDPLRAIVELTAEFRMPVARATSRHGWCYVDAEGYRLPEAGVPQWAKLRRDASGNSVGAEYYLGGNDVAHLADVSRIHYIIVDGVEGYPPAVGEKWNQADLASGLKLVSLISTKPHYAYQITTVDVRNFSGRIAHSEPHLRMYAQVGQSRPTDIRFGRFPRPGGDYVVSPQRKLSYLDKYVADFGSLAGHNSYIELRYDEPTFSLN